MSNRLFYGAWVAVAVALLLGAFALGLVGGLAGTLGLVAEFVLVAAVAVLIASDVATEEEVVEGEIVE